ncbi:hypothetical protein NA57DRAFT_24522, partial [Rhizodiscina lignyota]
STFTALNIEYDNVSDEEIDDTKEIQIEDALKLYQIALRYHSEGPKSFDKAADAYRALFESEIFKYPESQSELRRLELYGPGPEYEDLWPDEFEAGPVQLVATGETAPNTLPQILHLSYKNHGQFLLDTLQYKIQQELQNTSSEALREQARPIAKGALDWFAEALDKDDADLDLWGRSSGVASFLGSERIARYCLEAVLDDEEEGVNGVLALPGIEEGFAVHKLKRAVKQLQDDLALRLSPLSRLQKKQLSDAILRRLDPHKSMRLTLPGGGAVLTIARQNEQGERIILRSADRSWLAVGDTILRQFQQEQNGYAFMPGAAISIEVPPGDPSVESESVTIEPEPMAIEYTTAETKGVPEEIDSKTEADGSSKTASMTKDAGAVADVEMTESPIQTDHTETIKEDAAAAATEEPSRKRSSDSAGLPETGEGRPVRSKRIRARESITESSNAQDVAGQNAQQYAEDRLQPFTYADQILFETVDSLFSKLGVDGLDTAESLRAIVKDNTPQSPSAEAYDMATAIKDLHAISESSAPEVVNVLMTNDVVEQLGGTSREAGLNAFLGYAKSGNSKSPGKQRFPMDAGLDQWLKGVNSHWTSTPEIALLWIQRLLKQHTKDNGSLTPSSYTAHQWSDDLKRVVVQMIVHLDEFVYGQCLDEMQALDSTVLDTSVGGESLSLSNEQIALIEMVQSLFELHLDIYSLIKQPGSGVDLITQTGQKDRLERWSSLAHQGLQTRATVRGDDPLDELTVRHLWATAYHLGVCDDVAQDHVILCMKQLRLLLQSVDGIVIELQNNAVMPELSVAAIDRELSRIHMKDFFLRVFDNDDKDPVRTIEGLEPILEAPFDSTARKSRQPSITNGVKSLDAEGLSGQSPSSEAATTLLNSAPLMEMSGFLESANVSLRLSLWQRLREAYEAIDYPPKVVSCYLRCIELLTNEIKSASYHSGSKEQRYFMLLSWLRLIDEFLIKILARTQAVLGYNVNLDCIDEHHLQSSLAALVDLSRLLHAFNLFEDTVRVGLVTGPILEARQKSSFQALASRIHDMELRLWMLQYQLLKEGMSQKSEAFPKAEEDRFEYLRAVHYATGVRGFCKSSNKAFLRLLKEEFLRMTDVEGHELELSQILYDLYGLKCCPNVADLTDHGSTADVEALTRKTAMKLLDFLMTQAAMTPAKDLPKLELKATIDKVHGAIGRVKPGEDLAANKRMLNSYIKSPINPLELFRCLEGVGSLTPKSVSTDDAPAAAKGWYFLMGEIAFNKYLAQKQKNVQAVPTEDLNIAMAFYTQDLEFAMDRWETWYRLAQAYDLQLEEAVSWSAEKINSNAHEISFQQRCAIHCYTMAVACSMDDADPSDETMKKIAKVYIDFGTRIYSSSRQPFSMAAFSLRETETRFLSKPELAQEPVRGYLFNPLDEYTAWKFAATLFKRAIARCPDNWWSYYMLGKCLWKMYNAGDDVRNMYRSENKPNARPALKEVLDAFTSAIETLPQKRDSRKEPILEPHYKLVSITHKLVNKRVIEASAGADVLQASEFLRKVDKPTEFAAWEGYMLQVLKVLRNTDKSGWHHRMTARAAHVIYDDAPQDRLAAMGAKHELTQQMFTKTMAVQVWKPENERPGRHFVYTTRYTRFFIKLLLELDDRASMELLAKRVRRKPHDFFDHLKLWNELCVSYLKLLRRWGSIPEGHEDAVFKSLNHEDFVQRSIRIEAWCQNPDTNSRVLDVLRDVIELKRVNNGLMKATLIDDLVGDTYAVIYQTIGPELDDMPLPAHLQQQMQQLQQPQQRPVMSVGGVMNVDGAADAQQQFPPYVAQDGPGRPRTKGVGRRELQRRAEAAV